MEKIELTLEETIKQLMIQREDVVCNWPKDAGQLIDRIDNLIERARLLLNTDLSDRVLVGSLVDVEITYGEEDVEYEHRYLGLDFAEDTVSMVSPLGYNIFGVTNGDTVHYNVRGDEVYARILDINKSHDNEEIELVENQNNYAKALVK